MPRTPIRFFTVSIAAVRSCGQWTSPNSVTKPPCTSRQTEYFGTAAFRSSASYAAFVRATSVCRLDACNALPTTAEFITRPVPLTHLYHRRTRPTGIDLDQLLTPKRVPGVLLAF